MQLSCHSQMNICHNSFGARNNPAKCANQHLSAGARIYLLDTGIRSASVTPHATSVRDYWKGRVSNTALTDRRRQSCRTASKPSWPLASLPFLQPALSKKSRWPRRSLKSRLWRSSDQEHSRPGRKPRPNPRTGSRCVTFPQSLRLPCFLRLLPARNARMSSWLCRAAPSSVAAEKTRVAAGRRRRC